MRVVNGRAGFTLIELMIVVAIIGLLAAIAIPNFIQMQLRAKRSELPTNLAAIRTVEEAYFQSYDTYTSCAQNPSSTPGVAQQDWEDQEPWSMLGFKPDGKVRGVYYVDGGLGTGGSENVPTRAQPRSDPNASSEEGSSTSSTSYTATGEADVDGDEDYSVFQATNTAQPYRTTDANVY